jgi:dipeptide/tripeptide permease
LELAFSAAPNNMKSFVTACFLVTVGIGNSLDVPIGWLYTGNAKLGIPSLGPGPFFALIGATMLVLAVGIIPVGRKFNRGAAPPANGEPTPMVES